MATEAMHVRALALDLLEGKKHGDEVRWRRAIGASQAAREVFLRTQPRPDPVGRHARLLDSLAHQIGILSQKLKLLGSLSGEGRILHTVSSSSPSSLAVRTIPSSPSFRSYSSGV